MRLPLRRERNQVRQCSHSGADSPAVRQGVSPRLEEIEIRQALSRAARPHPYQIIPLSEGVQVLQSQLDERGLAGTHSPSVPTTRLLSPEASWPGERSIPPAALAAMRPRPRGVLFFRPYRTVRLYGNIRSHVSVQNARLNLLSAFPASVTAVAASPARCRQRSRLCTRACAPPVSGQFSCGIPEHRLSQTIPRSSRRAEENPGPRQPL